ncbi:MAG: hypothetical protein WCV59_03585 [Parcubacteria group bacterium]|jgi:hypothetical protein
MTDDNIFQKVLKVGDSGGDLDSLESEILEKRRELKAGFSGASREEIKRVRKYLISVFEPKRQIAFLLSE